MGKQPNFAQHFKNSPPPASPFRKRVNISREVRPRSEKTETIRKMESPVKGEMRPAYSVDFHCRERRGNPVMSYMMSVSPHDMCFILSHFICDAASRVGYDPNQMAQGIKEMIADATARYEAEHGKTLYKKDPSANYVKNPNN